MEWNAMERNGTEWNGTVRNGINQSGMEGNGMPALVASLNGEVRPRLAAGMPAALPHLASISVSYDSLVHASGNDI